MTTVLAGLLASIGLAIVITALTMPGRQTPAVINSSAWGLTHLTEAALGYKV